MFVHFFHRQLFTLYRIPERIRPRAALVRSLRHALHWSVFLTRDSLVMPTTDLVQSAVATEFVNDFRFLADCELLYFVGSTVNVDDLQASKRAHFGGTSLHPQWSQRGAKGRLRVFERNMSARSTDTTADVKTRWKNDVATLTGNDETFATRQLVQVRGMLGAKPPPSRYEAALYDIPERLGAHAFLWNVIEDLKIFPFETSPIARHHLELALGWNWALSYLDEYETTMVGRIPGIGRVDCGLSSTHPEALADLVVYDAALRALGLREAFAALSLQDLVRLREDPKVIYFGEAILRDVYRLLMRSDGRALATAPLLARLGELIRARVLAAHGPVEAMVIAAACAVDEGERTDRPVPRSRQVAGASGTASRPTIAVLVALPDELDTALTLIEEIAGPLTITEDEETGRIAYMADHGRFRLLFALVGRGQERAAVGTALVIGRYQPALAVSVGIAGALSDDVAIGDVVVGDQIVGYLANAKAVPGDGAGFQFQMAGEPLRSDELLVERAIQLPHLRRAEFRASRERVARDMAEPAAPVREGGYGLVAGPVACGPVVGAAGEFRKWLVTWKRDLVALDMETSGVAMASANLGTLRRVRFLALRGISDLANEDKAQLEQATKGGARRLAMRTPLEVLLILLDALPEATFR
ncbi:hypothetical protein ACLQ2P_26360 [Actinomadura citrea]|uniref:5'-methylthioadenosine/S-adenosylhomocysteine nucleosidase family protein n=1 Tax=Actinomadura citrea TaxID=46158 RepID=UPI003CE4EC12